MPQLDSDKALVTFHDVAAVFSEEEWKLLHKWQKELYNSVMKEIHQTLISLGYRILNPEMLLRIFKGGEAYIRGSHHPERRADINDPSSSVNPDILLRIKHEEEPYCSDPRSSEETGIRNSPSTGDMVANVNVLKREENLYVKDCPVPKVKERSDSLGTGREEEHDVISFIIQDEDVNYSVDHQASESRESSTTPTAGPVVTSVFSLSRYNKGKQHFKKEMEPERTTAGDGSMKRYSMQYMEKAPNSAASGQSNAHVFQSSEKGTNCSNQLWSETIQEVGEEKMTAFKSGFSNATPSDVCKITPKVDGSDTHGSESNLKNEKLLICQPNTVLNWRLYACTECEQSFLVKADLHQHQKIHLCERPCTSTDLEKSLNVKVNLNMHQRKYEGVTNPVITSYACTKCAETFTHKGSLMRHQRAHSGVRYTCSECEKSFTRKESLTAHKRTHTDQKPFQCTECQKSFKHKKLLVVHHRIHTREKPYKCTKCGKSFSVKGNLNTHERTHTGQKTYQCTECKKHFSSKMSLMLHGRTHTGEKPYQCTECGKSFSHKGNLTTHERKHTGQKPYQCTECEKSFTRKINLTLHGRTHMAQKLAHSIQSSTGAPQQV